MFETEAMVHSLKDLATVKIISQNGNNDVVAEYNGKICSAIFNPFSGHYYVDDVYGVRGDAAPRPSKHQPTR